MADRQRPVVHQQRQDRLRVEGVVQVDRFVIRHGRRCRRRNGRRCSAPGRTSRAASQYSAELRSLPLADRAPPLDAIVARDLRALRKATEIARATASAAAPTSPSTRSRQLAKPRRAMRLILRRSRAATLPLVRNTGDICVARDIRAPAPAPISRWLPDERPAPATGSGGTCGVGIEPVASGEQQPAARRAATEHARRSSWADAASMLASSLARQAIPAGDHRAHFVDRSREHDHRDVDDEERRSAPHGDEVDRSRRLPPAEQLDQPAARPHPSPATSPGRSGPSAAAGRTAPTHRPFSGGYCSAAPPPRSGSAAGHDP